MWIPSKAKLRLHAGKGLTKAYVTASQTISGTIGQFTFTASATLAQISIRKGSVIHIGASDHVYTVASVSGTLITVTTALTQTYVAGTGLKIDILQTWGSNDGHNNSPTQGTAGSRPAYIASVANANNKPAIEFPGGAKGMQLTSSDLDNVFVGGGTVAFVIGANDDGDGAAGRVIVKYKSGDTVEAWNIVTTVAAGGFWRCLFNQAMSGTNGAWTTNSVVALDIPQIVEVTYNSSTPTVPPIITVVGLEVPITQTTAPVGTAVDDAGGQLAIGNILGSGRGLNSRLFELFIWDRKLNAWEAGKLRKYWAGKYSIDLYDNAAKYYGGRFYYSTFPDLVEAPMLIELHGGTGDALSFLQQTQLGTTITNIAVRVVPTATMNGADANTWNSNNPLPTFNNAPDNIYLRDLIEHVRADALRRGIVITDVYGLGHSNGGMMLYRLIIENPTLFTGIVVFATDVMVSPNPNTFTGKILHYHGEVDGNIPFTGGVGSEGNTYPPVRAAVEGFTNADVELIVLPFPAAHTMATLRTALTLRPYETTFARIVRDFITS